MSAGSETMERATADREIVFTRVFAAPRERVFQAWTRPEQIPAWWGPRGFTTTIHEMEVRPGGVWRFTMHGPDGTDYPNRVVYTEVTPPERLAYDHGGDEGTEDVSFQVTVVFAEEAGGGTRITMRMLFASAEEREKMAEFGVTEGGNQTLDRLGEHLAGT